MAHKIEYLVGDEMNSRVAGNWSRRTNAHSWHAQEVLPDDLNNIFAIRLDNRLDSENVACLFDDEAEWKWSKLAPDIRIPDDLTAQTAVAFAEAIWLDMIWHHVTGHASVINSFFNHCLDAECDYALDPSPFDEITYNGKEISWQTFAEIGEESGVEYMIDAWLSGVDLEHVLAE